MEYGVGRLFFVRRNLGEEGGGEVVLYVVWEVIVWVEIRGFEVCIRSR